MLDRHLTQHVDRSASSEFTGLTEFTTVNRAIGVLLACGHTPEQAYTELWDQAARHASRDLHTTAQAVINSAELGMGRNSF